MKDVIDAIKKSVLEAVAASKPVAFVYGTIEEVEPLTIKLNQEVHPLGEKDLIFIEGTGDFDTQDIGKGVIFLRQQGGQKFLYLGFLKGVTSDVTEDR